MEREIKMKMQEKPQGNNECQDKSSDQHALDQSLAYSFILLIVMFVLIFC